MVTVLKWAALMTAVIAASLVIAWYLVFGSAGVPNGPAVTFPISLKGHPLKVGAYLYRTQCIDCHGQNGEGTDTVAIRLTGASVLHSFTPTSMADYIQYNMPGDAPGTLTHQESVYLAKYIYSLAKK